MIKFFSLKKKKLSFERKNTINTYLFLAPTIIGMFLFLYLPFITSLIISFTDWVLLRSPKFIGFENYINIFTKDPHVLNSFKVTIIFTIVTVVLKMSLSLLLALLLNVDVKGNSVYRFIYYLPSMVIGVPMAVLWIWMYGREGLVNSVLVLFGIEGPVWLYDKSWALVAVIIIDLWSMGNLVIIYLAGLKNIPSVYYESAAIDGAKKLTSFFKITLPLLSPIVLFNFFLASISSLQSFDNIFVLTRGGPDRATHLWSIMLYETAFQSREMGYASALGWLQFIVIFLFTIAIFRNSKRFVFYMAGD